MRSYPFILAAASCLVLLGEASARERYPGQFANVRPDIRSWYESQHDSEGLQCCAESDAYDFYGDYTLRPDGSVTLEADGVRREIPAYQVLTGPNPTGHAVWWHNESGGTYCFALGTGN
jgi:hypothetical protein